MAANDYHVRLQRIPGSLDIRSKMKFFQIFGKIFYLRTFGSFSTSNEMGLIYEECDILSKYIVSSSHSFISLSLASMEGKIVVKNPNGYSKVWKHFSFYKIENNILKDCAVCFVCKQECKYSGGTSNLNQHHEKHHKELCQSTVSTIGTKTIQSHIISLMNQPVVKMTPATKKHVH